MTHPWTLASSAGELDAAGRAELGQRMLQWLGDGGDGLALITCHRAELYGFGSVPDMPSARVLAGEPAVRHLLRVASGLESVIVGEHEVLHQVREALSRARAQRKLDGRIQRLFETAIAAGRKSRAHRTESSGNLAQHAVAWLRQKTQVAGRPVVVAGAGHMGAALAHLVAGAGAQVIIASRDVSRASRLARMYSGRGVDLGDGAGLARTAAGVAVALGGPWTQLGGLPATELPPIADISAPPAVPVEVRNGLNGGFLSIDDLYRSERPVPGAYIKDAEQVVALKTAEYTAWLERAR